MGLFQTKTKNYSKLGIKKTRLTLGNVRGPGGFKAFRGMKTLCEGGVPREGDVVS